MYIETLTAHSVVTRIARALTPLVVLLGLTGTLGAQTIRGTVEDSTGLPLEQVIVRVVSASGGSALVTVRTGNAGEFSVNLARAGRYRVQLNRIGYAPQTSNPIDLPIGEIVTVRFKMAVLAQRLSSMEIVERRKISLNELMSSRGFDVRQGKYPMNTMGADRLAEEGLTDVESLFRQNLIMGVSVIDDSTGASLRMSQMGRGARGYCFPEVYLDGTVLSEGDASSGAKALFTLSGYTARMIHGIEVYRGNQIPPPSIGGQFGGRSELGKPCGVVAVWTKAAREIRLIAERAAANGSVQVVRGTVIDFATGKPIAGALLTLQSQGGQDIEPPVTSDSLGTFAFRTKQFGLLRVSAKGLIHHALTTPPFNVEVEDLLTIEVIMATTHQPVAPIALISRELPQMHRGASFGGFGYRRRRGVSGTFFGAAEIARAGARTLAALVRGVPNVVVDGGPLEGTIAFKTAMSANTAATIASGPTCTPMYFLNGELERDPATKIRPLLVSQLLGVEVYPLATDLPAVYRMGSTGCGAIAVWTRDAAK
jgi:hypothetical protein